MKSVVLNLSQNSPGTHILFVIFFFKLFLTFLKTFFLCHNQVCAYIFCTVSQICFLSSVMAISYGYAVLTRFTSKCIKTACLVITCLAGNDYSNYTESPPPPRLIQLGASLPVPVCLPVGRVHLTVWQHLLHRDCYSGLMRANESSPPPPHPHPSTSCSPPTPAKAKAGRRPHY